MSVETIEPITHTPARVVVATLVALMLGAGAARAQDTAGSDAPVDIGSTVPTAAAVKEGLFPDDECEELKANGFKCMGFKPAVKYSLPASSFALGSAIIPALLKQQLDVFAEVLRGKNGSTRKVQIVGHADASGSQASNLDLSRRRAESVRDYLVLKGVSKDLLAVDGVGAQTPKNKSNPFSAENRRVEIGRANPPH